MECGVDADSWPPCATHLHSSYVHWHRLWIHTIRPPIVPPGCDGIIAIILVYDRRLHGWLALGPDGIARWLSLTKSPPDPNPRLVGAAEQKHARPRSRGHERMSRRAWTADWLTGASGVTSLLCGAFCRSTVPRRWHYKPQHMQSSCLSSLKLGLCIERFRRWRRQRLHRHQARPGMSGSSPFPARSAPFAAPPVHHRDSYLPAVWPCRPARTFQARPLTDYPAVDRPLQPQTRSLNWPVPTLRARPGVAMCCRPLWRISRPAVLASSTARCHSQIFHL